ncbi:ATP-binding protein [Streptomyces sediminimaris]|uniref:ATP-binding protein n=1 Tax=Streptomyces sediminimaris TaxID=3383721 RepID=UPI00399B1D77
MRYFNTAGPCLPTRHYMLSAQERLPQAREIVDQGQYFVVHAPRQTGKTTVLAAMARDLTASGRYAALRFSCEMAEAADQDIERAELLVLSAIRQSAEAAGLPDELAPPSPWPDDAPGARLKRGLMEWTRSCPRPLVLVFDEIDALQGQSLRSVLRQMRDGYTDVRDQFPHALALCGLRDVRDYKAASGGDAGRLGTSSPFNIKVASLRLGDFTEAEVAELYGQHTTETGQEFTLDAVRRAFWCTQGQPWLVNALAYEITSRMRVPLSEPVTAEHVDEAKERLILARATHLDSLAARLGEDRVRRIVQPLIAGELLLPTDTYDDDLAYVRDLGLVAPDAPVRVANPIYKEVTGTDRRHHQRRRPLHPRHRHRPHHLRHDGQDRPLLLLLPERQLHHLHLPAGGRLHLLRQRRQHLERPGHGRRSHVPVTDRRLHPGQHGRRLHLHLRRQRQGGLRLRRRQGPDQRASLRRSPLHRRPARRHRRQRTLHDPRRGDRPRTAPRRAAIDPALI